MKTGIGLLAAAALLACNDSSPSSSYKPTYTPAAKGSTVGSPVTATLDSAGGKIASADGRLEVTFPAGVLAAATPVSIQPLTNTAPHGLGGAYRLSPEGATFSQPVTLTFHLSDVENVAIDSTFVATQHADGLWYSQQNQARDATAKTVSVNVTHFSDWTLAQTARLDPPKARVKTSEATTFTATILIVNEEGDDLANPFGDDVAVPTLQPLNDRLNGTKTWSVNSIEGGNATLGQVRDPGSFTAPSKEPSPSAVTVTLTVELGKSKVIAAAEADIYTQEIWTGNTDVSQIDGTHIHADVTFAQKIESGSTTNLHFTVQSGQVLLTPPATNGSGCPQTVSPDTRPIGPNDGTLSITYDVASGPEDGTVIGGGTTAWPGTYTEMCSNGTQTIDGTVVAQWWPFDLSNPTGGLVATNGVLDGTITTPTATGTVHFVRQ